MTVSRITRAKLSAYRSNHPTKNLHQQSAHRYIQRIIGDYMTSQGTVNIAIRLLRGCIVLAYSVIAWGILCSRREDSGVAVQATAMRRHL